MPPVQVARGPNDHPPDAASGMYGSHRARGSVCAPEWVMYHDSVSDARAGAMKNDHVSGMALISCDARQLTRHEEIHLAHRIVY